VKRASGLQANLDLGASGQIASIHGNSKRAIVSLVAEGQFRYPQYYDIAAAIRAVNGWPENYLNDCYASINGLANRGSRSLSNVSQLTSFFVDFDYYKIPEYGHLDVGDFASVVLNRNPWLPEPTLTMDSGKGCWMFWGFKSPVDVTSGQGRFRNLPRWSENERLLVELLSAYGADSASSDASRSTRLAGTINSKNYATTSAWSGSSQYSFDEMVKIIQKQNPQPVKAPASKGSPAYKPTNTVGRIFNRWTMALHRMDDMKALGKMRGRYTDGRRRAYFLYACAAAFYCSSEQSLIDECDAFANEHFRDPERYTGGKVDIQDVIRRFTAYRQRMTTKQIPLLQVEGSTGSGRYYHKDNPYCITSKRYIRDLDITSDEMRGIGVVGPLKILIDKAVRSERRQKKRESVRRASGVIPRSDYLDRAQTRRAEALRLRDEGLKVRAIADRLGVAERTAKLYLAKGAK
jgi:hypothetical protein